MMRGPVVAPLLTTHTALACRVRVRDWLLVLRARANTITSGFEIRSRVIIGLTEISPPLTKGGAISLVTK